MKKEESKKQETVTEYGRWIGLIVAAKAVIILVVIVVIVLIKSLS